MTKLIFIVCFISLTIISFGQKDNLKAYIDVKDFYHPETGNYAEVELQISIQSTSLKTIGDTALQASLAIYFDFMSKNKLVKSDAYILNSPSYQIKDSLIEDFYEIKRYSLDPGKYELKMLVTQYLQSFLDGLIVWQIAIQLRHNFLPLDDKSPLHQYML